MTPRHCRSRLEALRLYTQGAAWFSLDEATLGSFEPGKLADLAVLSEDITRMRFLRGAFSSSARLASNAGSGRVMNSTTGIGEHSDIVETIELELEQVANYHDKLEMLVKYFIQPSSYIVAFLNFAFSIAQFFCSDCVWNGCTLSSHQPSFAATVSGVTL